MSDAVANGKTKTEALLRAALDSSDLDFTNLKEDQANALHNMVGLLPGVIEYVRENGGQLGLLPYHARQFALTIVNDPNDPV